MPPTRADAKHIRDTARRIRVTSPIRSASYVTPAALEVWPSWMLWSRRIAR